MFLRSKSKIYYKICISGLLLIILGTVFLISSSVSQGNVLSHLEKRILWLILSVMCLFVIYKIDVKNLKKYALPVFFVAFLLLPVPSILYFLTGDKGYLRWIKLGPASFQPAEVIKLTFVIFLASYLSRKDVKINEWKNLLVPVLLLLLIVGILQFQKDLGTVVVIGGVFFSLLFLAGLRVKKIICMFLAGILMLGGLALLFPYRRERIKNFLNPSYDTKGGYQIIQSKITLGSGGIFGKGLGAGRRKLKFLPVPNTDFIYAVVGEETGFIGTSFILFLFGMLVFSAFEVSKLTEDKFLRYLSAGIGALFGFQFLLHTMVVLALVPSKGTTLPFFSKGGTSFFVNCIALGILVMIARKVCFNPDFEDIIEF